jgi:hypothetical protein
MYYNRYATNYSEGKCFCDTFYPREDDDDDDDDGRGQKVLYKMISSAASCFTGGGSKLNFLKGL